MTSNSILILSHRWDEHAAIVKHCLDKKGIDSYFFYTDHFTAKARISFSAGPAAEAGWKIMEGERTIDLEKVNTVWYRRYVNPMVQAESIPEDQRKIAEMEISIFSQTLFGSMCQNARWVNPIRGDVNAHSKALQLMAAGRAGLLIPETVIGNDPARVRGFVGSGSRIYKTFKPHVWMELNKVYGTQTVPVEASDLPADELIQMLPGIYQERIRKKSDVRLFIFGDDQIAIELRLADNPRGIEDFRAVPLKERKGRLVDVRGDILAKCRTLMAELQIVNGSFDFLIDEEGNWIFLEVNSAGQFLWMEHLVPESRVLARFLKFLTGGIDFDVTGASVAREINLSPHAMDPSFKP